MLSKYANMNLENPWWLLLLAAIPLYFVLRRKIAKAEAFKIGIPEVNRDALHVLTWKNLLYKAMPFLLMLGFTLLTIAMARPVQKFQKQKITSDGIDIVIALDLSMSMLAKDFEPDRLTVAREVISDFIKGRPSDRIGLTVFAGEGYTASPPTLDHKVLLQFLSDTDGSNNSGVVDPLDAADIAATFGVKVYTIGIGTNGEALMPQFFGNKTIYRYSKVEIDEPLLNEIAMKTEGAYFRATDEEELKGIYEMINKLEKTEFDSTTLVRREDRYQPFLLGGLLLLLIHFGCKSTLFRNINTA